ncbi:hypothetical protein FGIG_10809 [Fasciola gigantica]|uniref:Macro domain-containing protein n=1 Tax=Fasciola gigantica TaxID=46835 RepID=A0A504YCW0_FASGI|nr:hypothetical protein FGIG_10809 [Fasciola gigantica]
MQESSSTTGDTIPNLLDKDTKQTRQSKSTPIGYPPHAAAEVAISTVLSYLSTHKEIERVVFCVFLPEDYELYKERIPKYLTRYSVAGQCTDAK